MLNEKTNVIITDVIYTVTDETYYVLNRIHNNAKRYLADTIEEVFENLENDGWNKCGKIKNNDDKIVDMFEKDDNYITVWKDNSN